MINAISVEPKHVDFITALNNRVYPPQKALDEPTMFIYSPEVSFVNYFTPQDEFWRDYSVLYSDEAYMSVETKHAPVMNKIFGCEIKSEKSAAFISEDGEVLTVAYKDSGFEVSYSTNGLIAPKQKLTFTRGSIIIEGGSKTVIHGGK